MHMLWVSRSRYLGWFSYLSGTPGLSYETTLLAHLNGVVNIIIMCKN